jgi:hypothetical protein
MVVQLWTFEWLLSTLFDASLLSPLSRRTAALFFVRFILFLAQIISELHRMGMIVGA